MNKLTYFLIALLLCVVFAGSASAWGSNSEAIIHPSGGLVPGDDVSGRITIKIPQDSKISQISVSTDLTSAAWTCNITGANGHPVTQFEIHNSINGGELSGIPEELILTINLDGEVPNSKAGQDIIVMTIEESASSGNIVSKYTSPKQPVYDPAALPDQITCITESISQLNNEITECSKQGVNVSAAILKLETARSHVGAAENNRHDVAVAYKELASTNTAIGDTKKELVNTVLAKANSNLAETKQIIENLKQKGWTSDNRVTLLSALTQTAESQYTVAHSAYGASKDSVSDSAKSLSIGALNSSVDALNEANALWEEAQKSLLDAIGSSAVYIVLIVVAIIVVIGAIIVIRRRTDNRWD